MHGLLKKLISIFIFLSLVVVSLFAFDIYKDRQNKIEIIEWTDLQTKPFPADYNEEGNILITRLPPHSQVKVLRITYGKDYMAIKVKTADDRKGWIIYNGELNK